MLLELPLLPKDLDIIILRPSGPDPTAEMTRQFRKRFRVRRRVLEIWLEFLANNRPGQFSSTKGGLRVLGGAPTHHYSCLRVNKKAAEAARE
jgi:hypothetical protein